MRRACSTSSRRRDTADGNRRCSRSSAAHLPGSCGVFEMSGKAMFHPSIAHRLGVIGVILVVTSIVHGQIVLTPEYERLRQYEGIYEDEGGGTLQIRASPRDNVLVAVLEGAKYPLKTAGADLFTNNAGQRVKFSLGTGHEGYRLLDSAEPGRLYRRIGAGTPLDERIWYPRAHSSLGYKYAPPLPRDDGLPVGAVEGPALDLARLREMGNAIAAGSYPDVHSVLVAQRAAWSLRSTSTSTTPTRHTPFGPPPRASCPHWWDSRSRKDCSTMFDAGAATVRRRVSADCTRDGYETPHQGRRPADDEGGARLR